MEEAVEAGEVEVVLMEGSVVVVVVLAEEDDTKVQAVASAAGVVVVAVAVASATIVAGWVIWRGIVIEETAVRLLAVEGAVDTAVVGVMAAAAAAAVVIIVEIQDILLGIVKTKANEECGSSFKRYLHFF